MSAINRFEVFGKFVKVNEWRWIRMSSICTVTTSNVAPRFYVTLGVCTAEFFETVYIGHNSFGEADDYAARLIIALSHE
jgi:hypothetical protein